MNRFYNYMSFLLVLCVLSCTSWKANLALTKLGIYDDDLNIVSFFNNKQTVVFVPMKHAGTKSFYNNVKLTIDSLTKENYLFYTEFIDNDTTYKDYNIYSKKLLKLMKYEKLIGNDSLEGPEDFFKALYGGKVKLKKELIAQPAYSDLGMLISKNKHVDITSKEIVMEYQRRTNTEVLLIDDFNVDREVYKDIIIEYRNRHVINELKKDSHQKIAIVYGSAHFIGIKNRLLNLSYKETVNSRKSQ